MTTRISDVEVYWYNRPWDGNMLSDPGQCSGVLTCDHSQSSYGLPVLVRDDGAVFGPADLPDCAVLSSVRGQFHLHHNDDAIIADFGALHAADPESFPHSADDLREIRAIINGAIAAGFRLEL